MKKIIVSLLLFGSLEAAPVKGRVAHGSAQLKSESVKFSISQASEKLIINWDSFSIGAHESVHFDQPSKKSVALNRVTGNLRSDLLGTMTANGKVYLVNPNGVLIGPKGKIKTSGFIASALEIADENFLSEKGHRFFGGKGESVENQGEIRVEGGEVFLIGGSVQNSGSIHADAVALLAGDEVLLRPEEESYIFVSAKAEDVDGSDIYSLAINHEGLIESGGAEMRGGRVYLHAKKGKAKVSGKVEAGSVHVLGESVEVREKAQIEVSGKNGGGEVLIGGDYRGSNPGIQNAKATFVEKGSCIKADALESGNGGKVIVWGEEKSHFYGNISARGGNLSGDGGFVEISSPKDLIFSGGMVNTQAPNGKWGRLLLDPSDITISAAASSPAFTPPTYNPAVASANLNNGDLQTALGTTSVTVATSAGAGGVGMITVSANVTWAAATTLSLLADRNILVSSGVTVSSTGTGGFVAMDFEGNAGGASTGAFDGIVLDGATLSTVDGGIVLEGRGGDTGNENFGIDLINSSLINSTAGGLITLLGTSGSNDFSHAIRINNSQVTSVDGNIQVNGTGTGANSSFGLNMINGGSILSSGSGNIELNVSSNATGAGPNGLRMATASISATDGTIDITATSNGAGTGGQGIVMQPGTIESLGTGDLTLNATGGTGITSVALNATTASVIRAGDGTIDITALSQGSDVSSHGISLATGSSINSTGSGTMTISGTGSGTSGAGLFFSNGQILSATGPIDITAVGSGADGFTMTDVADRLGGAGSSGNITVSTDTITLAGQTQSSGNLIMQPIGTTISMGLGTGATGTFNLDTTEIGTIQDGFALRTFGRTNATNSVDLRIPSYTDNMTILGGTITLGANITSSDPVTLTLTAQRTIINSNFTISNTHTGSGNFNAINLSANAAGLETGDFDAIAFFTGVLESAEGNISIQGQGGTATGNQGVAMLFTSEVNSTGTGADAATIDITGLSGTGDTSQGILFGISSVLTTVDGAITLLGTSVGTDSLSAGVIFDSSASISSTGTTPGGAISIQGFGSANGNSTSHGIQFSGTGAGITTTNGMVTLEGTAGGDGTGTQNDGVQIASGAVITSNGTGASVSSVSITGTGGLGLSQNRGIFISSSGGVGGIDTTDGDIVLDGTGGSNTSSAGVQVQSGAIVRSLGAGADAGSIMVTAEGGPTGNSNSGLLISGTISSVDGNITIDGTGGASGAAAGNNGITFAPGTISSSGAALIDITGTGTGLSGIGTLVSNGDIINGSGLLTITGTGAGSSTALLLAGASAQIGGGSGDVQITVENATILGGQILGTGDLTIQTVNPATDIGLGTGAAGTLSLDNTALGTIQTGFNTVFFGRTNATDTVEMQAFTYNPNPLVVRGSTVNVLGAIDNGTENITFEIGVSGAGIGATTIDALVTTSGAFVVNGNAPTNTFDVGVTGLSATLNGGGTANTLTGPDLASAWTIDGNNQGTLNTTVLFNTMQTLLGGSSTDTFTFTGAFQISGGIDGGAGINTVQGPAINTLWSITGDDQGSIEPSGGGVTSLTNIQSFVGGSTINDVFTFTGPFRLSAGIVGGTGTSEVIGPDVTTQWHITNNDAGTIFPTGASGSTALTTIENLSGGSGNDAFTFDGAFSLSGNIIGGGGSNNIVGPDLDTSWSITADDAGSIVPMAAGSTSFLTIQTLTGGSGSDDFTFNGAFQMTGSINGGAGLNMVQGPNLSAFWSITGNNQGSIDPGSGITSLFNIQNFVGGSMNDVFSFSGSFQLDTGIDGGAGTNEVIGPDITTQWNITGDDAGTIFPSGALANTALAQIQNFTGGSGNDTFTFDGAFSLSGGLIGGGGTNSIEGPNIATTWNITGNNAGDVTPMGAGSTPFSTIQSLTGGSGNDIFNLTGAFSLTGEVNGGSGSNALNGPDLATEWSVTGNNAGTIFPSMALTTTSFTNIQSLSGGSLNDRFTFTGPFQILGASPGIDGGGGTANEIVGPDVNTTWIITGADSGSLEPTGSPGPTLFVNIQQLTGGSADDSFDFSSGFTLSGIVDGGGGRNLIIGPNAATNWNLTSDNAGNAAGIVFINITDLTGGSGDDDFIFSDQVDFSGHIDGGGGFNTLDYTAFTTPVIINPILQEASNLGDGYSNIQNIIGNVIFVFPPTPANPDAFRGFIVDLSATLNQYLYYLVLWRTYEKGYQWFDSIYRRPFDSSDIPRWKTIIGKDAYAKFQPLPY